MSQQDITGKSQADRALSGRGLVLYRLSDTWQDYCQALKVQVSDVEALAAQGEILEAFPLLSKRLAGIDRRATAAVRPASAPFVRLEPVATSGPSAELSPATQGAGAALSSQSTANGVPIAGLARAAGGLALHGQSVSASKTGRRFRPLVRSRFSLVSSVRASRISMQFFVLNHVLGGASNGHA
ncbi:hypothetical protein CtesDRAFT_PD2885 [Comamonas testosteroni KF-1]|uniref:Uncharacterized protein n=1 Tax=Comamonas testosteroni (strain DSM 14576 / KF-1) TaxID=399795 RepID=B7WXT7_COMTK|nr:hypothetical protein CtesDRAFT_PD2885 [Comamonas testosteroni KF-1]